MKWEGGEESENVDDRRGLSPRTMVAGGGGLLILIVALILGVDPQKIAQLVGPGAGGAPDAGQQAGGAPDAGQQQGRQQPVDPAEEKQAHFTKIVFRETEVIWGDLFRQMGKTYPKPTLVLFNGRVESACGLANAAVGPFYCPGDANVYIDLSFYSDMQRKLKAPGDFARAYVVAHEVGHHVQRLLGYSARVDEARRGGDEAESNRASVRLELQADYLAGVWAYHAQKKFNFLEPGDVETALNAANQIGDDRLQQKARGYVVPDSFTHGTSKQRMRWFSQGFKTGSVEGARELFERRYEGL